MKINRTNYEAFLIDYLDGNVSPKLKDEIDLFMSENPDIAEEFSSIADIQLEAPIISYSNKQGLKRDYTNDPQLLDEACVTYLENDMSEKEQRSFEDFIVDDSVARKTLETYQKCKFTANTNIVFSNKTILKRTDTKTILLRVGAAAAIISGLFIGLNQLLPQHPEHLAQVEERFRIPPKIQSVQIEMNTLTNSSDPQMAKMSPRAIDKELANEAALEVVLMAANIRDEIPQMMEPIATTGLKQDRESLMALCRPKIKAIPEVRILSVGEYLAQRREQRGTPRFFNNIAKAGLNWMSSVTGNKLRYDETNKGDIINVSLNTKLVAFNVAHKSEKNR